MIVLMDSNSSEFSDPMGGLKFDDETVLSGSDQSPNLAKGFISKDNPVDIRFLNYPSLLSDTNMDPADFGPSSSLSLEMDPPDDNEFSDTVLKYLNQILMEENIEEKPSTFHDPLALQAAEKSFYEVLGKKYPPSPNQTTLYIDHNVESLDGNFSGASSESRTNNSSGSSNSTDPHCIADSVEFTSSISPIQRNPVNYRFQPALQSCSQWSLSSTNSFNKALNGSEDSSVITHMVSNIFSDRQSMLQFKRGMEEASKFLPRSNSLMTDLGKYALPPESKEVPPEVVVKLEKDERDNGLRVRKNHHREDSDTEEKRGSKHSTVCVEEAELSEMFDRVLLSTEVKVEPSCYAVNEELHTQNGKSNGGKTHAKKQDKKEEEVDLRTLLINCAQSVASNDYGTANEQLKQIRQHASPSGNGNQRLAHIFANALEARLAGTGSQIYTALASKRLSAADMLKAYQLYISASPFKKIAISFANFNILEVAEKATKLHIIDFGIFYGFQWPILIQRLSTRPGGPPKLHITGIEIPQRGFRPAERVEETGRRLSKYCERFNVPFEYNAIAKKWQTIQIDDLKIESEEMLVVNCLFRFRNLLDETVVLSSPRDAVLELIRKINPTIFLPSIINGSYNTPFFVTRFREALFHYSAMFDMFDVNIPRDDQDRLMYEREFFGREIMNVIACEGSERVERPETYKQWQVRNMRAGLRPLPLNQEIVKKLKTKMKAGCHKDFVIEEDGCWMLLGWKGRIVYASSCWVPA